MFEMRDPINLHSPLSDLTYCASSESLTEAIIESNGRRILTVMLISQLFMRVESDTFAEQRYVLGGVIPSLR